MAEEMTTVQAKVTTVERLRYLAKSDKRTYTGELEWLIEQEETRRYSQPNPAVTVAEAQQAHQA